MGNKSSSPDKYNNIFRWQYFATIAVMILTFIYLNSYKPPDAIPLRKSFNEFPQEVGLWKQVYIRELDDKTRDILKVHDYVYREYDNNNEKVTLYIGYYGAHVKGEEIHSPKICMPAGGWMKLSERIRKISVDSVKGGKIRLTEAVYERNRKKMVFLYWYQLHDKQVTNEFLIKPGIIINTLRYKRPDSAFIRISTMVEEGGIEEAIVNAEMFLKDFAPVINTFLP